MGHQGIDTRNQDTSVNIAITVRSTLTRVSLVIVYL